MRHIAGALIASLVLGACTESARRVLGPVADPIAGAVTVETIIDFKLHSAALPALRSRTEVRLPKTVNGRKVVGSVTLSFVIDTSGFVIPNSMRVEPADGEVGAAFHDWLRDAQFEPVRRGGRPVRVAVRNLVSVFQMTR